MGPRISFRILSRVDAWANRIYGSRWNPLYHSGAITVALLGVLLVTGIYLLVFYRLGAPYESVAGLNEQVWAGRWIRGLHRFASDAAVVAAGVHAFRMYAQRRSWGPRALAWVSGVVLLAVIFVSGWTGYVLVWDTHAQVLAVEGARLLDALPVFSEPISRSFTGERDLPSAFFFLNLFAHIALPLTLGILLWVHVARVARPVLLPARGVLWGTMVALTAAAVLWPLSMAPAADLFRVPAQVPTDWFYGFWLPVTQRLPAGVVWAAGAALTGLAIAVPWLTRPRVEELPAPAVVNERACTGCEQCVSDCPYDAIAMVARTDGREGYVARVRTELCTSCGVCIGSCPPMAIGPLGVTGRDQLAEVRWFLAEESPGPGDVVIVGCEWSAARGEAERSGAKLLTVPCVGAMHSSTVEFLLRGGAGGVLVVGCPEHDGRTREGVTWTSERLFEGRGAELKERVDRSRLRLVEATLGEGVKLHGAATAFAAEIDALARLSEEEQIDLLSLCRTRREAAGGPAVDGGEAAVPPRAAGSG
ncbi:MAG TPA: cytochrome b N-terminal domain-containing protein [Longimicrobiales bacterium]|nr:cytochrome b N-terminal domain-containing protein [Longimicrobiales bacterium]